MQEMHVPVDVLETEIPPPPAPILRLAPSGDQRSPRDIEIIAQLQAQVMTLQEELERMRSTIKRYEALLRNATQREIELRSELTVNRK